MRETQKRRRGECCRQELNTGGQGSKQKKPPTKGKPLQGVFKMALQLIKSALAVSNCRAEPDKDQVRGR